MMDLKVACQSSARVWKIKCSTKLNGKVSISQIATRNYIQIKMNYALANRRRGNTYAMGTPWHNVIHSLRSYFYNFMSLQTGKVNASRTRLHSFIQ